MSLLTHYLTVALNRTNCTGTAGISPTGSLAASGGTASGMMQGFYSVRQAAWRAPPGSGTNIFSTTSTWIPRSLHVRLLAGSGPLANNGARVA